MKRRTWRNWAGNVEAQPAEFAQPSSVQELVEVVQATAKKGRSLRVAGSGHSYSAIVATDGTLLSLDKLQGVEDVNRSAGEATVLAGTKLRDLSPLLNHEGLALENLGDYDAQSLAGAISTATHGTGITLGCLSTQVIGLTLVTADGNLLQCSSTQEPEIFRAAQVSMGSLGVIAKVRLKLLPSYRLHRVKRNRKLRNALSEVDSLIQQNRHWEFWYWPYSDRVSTRTSNFTDAPVDVSRIKRFWENIVVDSAGLWVLSKLCSWIPPLCAPIGRLAAKLNTEGESVNESYLILATPRLVRFTEMEYAIPSERGPECLREVTEFIEKELIRVSFPIEYRYVAADDIYLSPFYERDSALIDVQQFKGMRNERYFRGAEAIFKKYGGRPHWGKIHYRTADELRELYPMWDTFQRIRHTLDPNGMFMNDYLRRVIGE